MFLLSVVLNERASLANTFVISLENELKWLIFLTTAFSPSLPFSTIINVLQPKTRSQT